MKSEKSSKLIEQINRRVGVVNLLALFKAVIVGILSAEAFYVAKVIANLLEETIKRANFENWAIAISVLCLVIVGIYVFVRGLFFDIWKILKSLRFDIYVSFLLGISISISFNGIGTNLYKTILSYLNISQVLVLILTPIIVGLLILIRAVLEELLGGKKEDPFFIPDKEERYKNNDLLDYANQATLFAERIYNNGSENSLVFGIDAPWGVGKSTFINFCIESFEEKKYKDRVVVYRFNPLRYEDRTNLLEKFIDGLITTIQKNTFAPEIRPLISHYSRIIKSKVSAPISFFGIGIKLSPGTYTVDDAFNDLESALKNLKKKIVIIVDDLDRLELSAIKDVLFTLKTSFNLPNVSYVICYDTENIATLNYGSPDDDKLMEFFEKFVNVKVSLFIDNKILEKYVTDNFNIALQNNLGTNPITREKIREAICELVNIYKSQEAHLYQSFIGDIRKLKRLINTIMLLKIEETDFGNSDFDKSDLVHLLLIYINYPNIFRKIYNTETGGKRRFFSVVAPHEDGFIGIPGQRSEDGQYENSTYYKEYLKSLNDNQRFLLNKIFDVTKRLPDTRRIDSVSPTIKKSYACFNGGWGAGKNLEEYLHLIVKLVKPQKRGQYKFYLNARDKVKGGTSPEAIFKSEKDFSFSESENSHLQFWNIIMDTANDLDSKTASVLIDYLLNHITDYSLFKNAELGVGLRHELNLYLVKLLNDAGWSDQNGEHYNNIGNNLSEIADWIFGENRHLGSGVLDLLSKEDRGVFGLYDLLAFRLFCSADRNGGVYHIQEALSKHGNPDAITSGSVNDIAIGEMREISQRVFKIFKSQYIEKKINIFDVIDKITLEDISGKYLDYINSNISSGKVKNVNETVSGLKSNLKSFIIYQLGNSLISLGVGCGYYDPTGNEDKKGIKLQINDYIFGICFEPSDDDKYEHFLDYLLINLSHNSPLDPRSVFSPNVNEFTKVLEKEKLINYWEKHGAKIKELNFPAKEKTIFTPNYSATYKEDLSNVYKVLDDLINEQIK